MTCPRLAEHVAACTRAAGEVVRLLNTDSHALAVRKAARLEQHLSGLLVEVQQDGAPQ